jgi:serine/threonine-protein kinase RsbW
MTYTKTVSCEKSSLKVVREFVAGTLQQHQISDSEINMIVVAIDEVCANLIIHSHHCNKEEHIEIRIIEKAKGFMFEIRDQGETFNISDYSVPSMEKIIKTKSSGGIGLILVTRIMDSIQVDREGTFNVCRLFKSLSSS